MKVDGFMHKTGGLNRDADATVPKKLPQSSSSQ